jgi:hypothetical protein
MADFTPDDPRRAEAPIRSLISKSEKAQEKLAPGSWQHTMLRDNVQALRLASVLLGLDAGDVEAFTLPELQQALDAIASMIGRTENVQTKFAPGTSQATLQLNRLAALRVAEAAVSEALEERRPR